MADYLAPVLFSDQTALLADQVVLIDEMAEALSDMTDPISTGMVRMRGDLAGSNSSKLVSIWIDNVGFNERFTAMDTETGPIPESAWSEIPDDITIGRYGLAKSQSYQSQAQASPGRFNVSKSAIQVVRSWMATVRYLAAVRASTISTVIGTSGVAWSLDNELALLAALRETPGVTGSGRRILGNRHPKQVTQLINSMRNDPLYQGQYAALLAQVQTAGNNGTLDIIGQTVIQTEDTVTDGTDYLGGAWLEGAMGLAVCSTGSIRVSDPGSAAYFPDMGMILQFEAEGNTAKTRFDANAWIGVDLISESLLPARRIRSTAS